MESLNEQGKFLTVAAPSPPVPLASKSYQLIKIPPSFDSTMIIPSSSNNNGDRPYIPLCRKKGSRKGLINDVADEDPKRLKKLMLNRVSAQKCRMNKLQYVADLEKQVKELEKWVACLGSQVATYEDFKDFLEMEQADLKRQIAEPEEYAHRVEAEIARNRAAITRLIEKLWIQQESDDSKMPVSGYRLSKPSACPFVNDELTPSPPATHPRQS